jgi:uncharacterized membrane protein
MESEIGIEIGKEYKMKDPLWVTALRVVHIACGFAAFFVAPVVLAMVKGGKQHRRWGKVYFWLMAVVAATALVLSVYRPVVFLALVAVFSFYMAFTGYRVLFRQRPEQGEKARMMDWVGAVLMLGTGVLLILLGGVKPTPLWARLSLVAIAFGITGIFFGLRDIQSFLRRPKDKNFWWYHHMGGMIGSYIAAVSAFSVINLRFLPAVVRWLWPLAIGVPVILIWIRYYRQKFNSKKTVSVAA